MSIKNYINSSVSTLFLERTTLIDRAIEKRSDEIKKNTITIV